MKEIKLDYAEFEVGKEESKLLLLLARKATKNNKLSHWGIWGGLYNETLHCRICDQYIEDTTYGFKKANQHAFEHLKEKKLLAFL